MAPAAVCLLITHSLVDIIWGKGVQCGGASRRLSHNYRFTAGIFYMGLECNAVAPADVCLLMTNSLLDIICGSSVM